MARRVPVTPMLAISNHGLRNNGGIERYAMTLVRGLHARGITPTVLAKAFDTSLPEYAWVKPVQLSVDTGMTRYKTHLFAASIVMVPDVSQDTDRGAEALLWMRSFAQDDLDERRCLRPNLVRPPLDAFRRPIGIAPMARWHVFAHGGVLAVRRRAHMDCDTIAVMEQLDGPRRDPRPQRLAQQRMRHRIIVLLDLDMIIEAGLALLPFRVDVRCGR